MTTPSELFGKLLQSKPYQIVDFPRKDPDTDLPLFEVAIMLLSQQETMAVAAAAERQARRIMKDNIPGKEEKSKGYDDVFNNASAIELLFRACRHPEDISKPLFPSKEALSDTLLPDEIAILLNHYFTVQVEFGPIVGAMTEAELDVWIKKLAEGGGSSQYFLNSFSWEAMKSLLIVMAVRSRSLETDKSSAGLPQEEPQATE